jgi:hypothetical protein
MHRIEGRALVAYWLLVSCSYAAIRLLMTLPELLRNLDGWRAAAGPALAGTLGIIAAIRLLRRRGGFRLAAVVLTSQVLTLSLGALAYRLDVGPFVRVAATGNRLAVDVGNDARLLLILGSGNHVPAGVAINVVALGVLSILVASRHAILDVAAG